MAEIPSNPMTAASSRGLQVAAVLVILVTALAYLPGLSGPFVFDDYGTLSRLGDFGGVRDWPTFKSFVLGGSAGPLGRPLALLTFLIDGTSWPTEAWPFKRTNLALHILTGAMLLAVTAKILSLSGLPQERARWVALGAAALWLLHPFLVSTTLYAVQRMAQLAAFFALAGLALYLHGRTLLRGRPAAGYLIMTLGIGGGTLLGTLAKENGVLLPLLALVLEATIIASARVPLARPSRLWLSLFLGLPVAAVLAYLLRYVLISGFFETNINRGYSIYERLLTEARVLADYLMHWFLPPPLTSGVFQDHVVASTGLFSPSTTLAAVLLHAALLALAIRYRRRLPLAAFGTLFFYAAHLLESTVINLELYFEHRNYLAAAFLYLPFLVLLEARVPRGAFLAAAGALSALLAGFTLNSSLVWADYDRLVANAARIQPASVRASQQYALQQFNAGDAPAALATLDAAIGHRPDNQNLALTRIIIRCRTGRVAAGDIERFGDVVGDQAYDARLLGAYESLLGLIAADTCPSFSVAALKAVFERMLEHPMNADPAGLSHFQLRYLLGLADLQLGDSAAAETHLRASLRARPTANRAMLMASLMANAKDYPAALRFTEDALRHRDTGPANRLTAPAVSVAEIHDFQRRLRESMRDNGGAASPGAETTHDEPEQPRD